MKAIKEKNILASINNKPFFARKINSKESLPFFFPSTVQPKLKVVESRNSHGQEADAKANGYKALGMDTLTDHDLTNVEQQTDGVQRKTNTEPSNSKKFTCSDYAGDVKLEACLNDRGRLEPGDKGSSVEKVQRGLNNNLQENGIVLKDDGAFGQKTGQAVMFFKKKHSLGFANYPNVGPGTMGKLDELCSAVFQKQPPIDWTRPPVIDGNPPEKLPPCPLDIDTSSEEYAYAATAKPLFAVPGVTCNLTSPPGKDLPDKTKTRCENGICHSLAKDKKGNIINPDILLNVEGKNAHDLFQKLFTPVNELRFVTQVDLVRELVRPAIQERIIDVVAQKASSNGNSFFIQRGDLSSIINGLNTLKQAVNDPVLEKENVFLKDGTIPIEPAEKKSKIDRIPGVPAERKLLLERINGLKVLCESQLLNPQAQNDPKAADRQRVIAIALSQTGTVFGDIPETVDPNAEQEGRVRIGYKRLIEYFATAFGDPSYLKPGHYNYENQKHIHKGNVWTGFCLDADKNKHDPVSGNCPLGQTKEVKSGDVQPEWCGIFVLWAFKSAGFSVGKWKAGDSIADIAGFKPVDKKDVKPGDVGVIRKHVHHIIVVKVNADPKFLTTVEGNSSGSDRNSGGEVSINISRDKSSVSQFYRVVELQ